MSAFLKDTNETGVSEFETITQLYMHERLGDGKGCDELECCVGDEVIVF